MLTMRRRHDSRGRAGRVRRGREQVRRFVPPSLIARRPWPWVFQNIWHLAILVVFHIDFWQSLKRLLLDYWTAGLLAANESNETR